MRAQTAVVYGQQFCMTFCWPLWSFGCRCIRRLPFHTNASLIRTLQWPHNGRDGIPIHQPHDWLLNRSIRRRSKKTPKLRVTGLYAGNSPVTGEFHAQVASDAENVCIWWRHHSICVVGQYWPTAWNTWKRVTHSPGPPWWKLVFNIFIFLFWCYSTGR